MSVPHPLADEADQLRALVSAVLSGAYKEESYLWDVASLCRTKPEFARQLVVLIDRYHRLGQMPAEQHRKIREKIAQTLAPREPAAAKAAPPDAPRQPPDATTTAPLPIALPAQGAVPVPAPALASSAPALPSLVATAAATAAASGAAAQVAALEATEASNRTIAPGTVLRNRYELQALLGYGGMGSVYKALDRYRASLGLSDCCVALKIASTHSSHAGNVSSLGREFHNAQRLSHPNVVNVYEIDHEGATSFYTMELLEGERLSQLTERIGGPLPLPYALTIIRDIGAAIAHAHSRAVVHADLKPHNIFITYGGHVRVLDFGGLSLMPREPWIEELTPENSSTGGADGRYRTATPAYASCEQLEGQRADPRDDIYSLACIAYELLAGRLPFDGSSSLEARTQRLRPRRPPALSAHCWRALRRGLAFDREKRPARIEPWLEQLGVADAAECLPPSHQLTAIKLPHVWTQRVAVAAVLLLALGGAVAFSVEHPGAIDWRDGLADVQTTLQGAWQQLLSGAGSGSLGASAVPAAQPEAAPAPEPADKDVAPSPAPATLAVPTAAAAAPADASASPSAAAGVKFASSSYVVADNAAAASVVVRRTGGSANAISFIWWTEQGSAKADVDFAPLGRRTEHIPSGADNVTLYIPIISNPLRHQTTRFSVALGRPQSADAAEPEDRATVTIERGG